MDLTLVSNKLSVKCNWTTVRDTCGSDYFPIIIKVGEQVTVNEEKGEKWKLSKADWEQFKEMCQKFSRKHRRQ